MGRQRHIPIDAMSLGRSTSLRRSSESQALMTWYQYILGHVLERGLPGCDGVENHRKTRFQQRRERRRPRRVMLGCFGIAAVIGALSMTGSPIADDQPKRRPNADVSNSRLLRTVRRWLRCNVRNRTSLAKDFLSWPTPLLSLSPKPIPTL